VFDNYSKAAIQVIFLARVEASTVASEMMDTKHRFRLWELAEVEKNLGPLDSAGSTPLHSPLMRCATWDVRQNRGQY
jgi:hypothetical protein